MLKTHLNKAIYFLIYSFCILLLVQCSADSEGEFTVDQENNPYLAAYGEKVKKLGELEGFSLDTSSEQTYESVCDQVGMYLYDLFKAGKQAYNAKQGKANVAQRRLNNLTQESYEHITRGALEGILKGKLTGTLQAVTKTATNGATSEASITYWQTDGFEKKNSIIVRFIIHTIAARYWIEYLIEQGQDPKKEIEKTIDSLSTPEHWTTYYKIGSKSLEKLPAPKLSIAEPIQLKEAIGAMKKALKDLLSQGQ